MRWVTKIIYDSDKKIGKTDLPINTPPAYYHYYYYYYYYYNYNQCYMMINKFVNDFIIMFVFLIISSNCLNTRTYLLNM